MSEGGELTSGENILVVHHTFRKTDEGQTTIHIFSARPATHRERRQVMAYLSSRAEAKGLEIEDLVNDMLSRDIALVEDVK